jgi:hypothetical protein
MEKPPEKHRSESERYIRSISPQTFSDTGSAKRLRDYLLVIENVIALKDYLLVFQ